jgi:hypothetical protein
MKKGDGFLTLRFALSLAAVFACMLLATAQYVGVGKGASAESYAAGDKDKTAYLSRSLT